MCPACEQGRHEECQVMVPTGYTVPDRDPFRTAGHMVPEFRACTCGCQDVEVPW